MRTASASSLHGSPNTSCCRSQWRGHPLPAPITLRCLRGPTCSTPPRWSRSSRPGRHRSVLAPTCTCWVCAIRSSLARAFGTLDWVSGGRAVIGAGAGWLRSEWEALGIDPATRGARLDEAILVCRRLWTEESVAHEGPHFPFAEVAFEPKPVQQPIPIYVGGESAAALRRAGRLGDGWIGMGHRPSPSVRRWRPSGPIVKRRGGSTPRSR